MDFGTVGYAVKGMSRTPTTSLLSPTLRMQLWLACSGVDAGIDTTSNVPDLNSLWTPGWYDRALSSADQMEYAIKESGGVEQVDVATASLNTIFFDPTIKGDSTQMTIECVKAFQVINNDVPRTLHTFEHLTYPVEDVHLQLPDTGSEQASLTRVLRAFVATRPDINYTQGMNFIAAFFLRVLWWGIKEQEQEQEQPSDESNTRSGGGDNNENTENDENDENDENNDGNGNGNNTREVLACGLLRRLANDMGMDEMWRVGFPLLIKMSQQLMTNLNTKSMKLVKRLEKEHLPPSAFTTNWLITLFTNDNTFTPAELLCWWDQLFVHFACQVRPSNAGNATRKDIEEREEDGTAFVMWSSNEERQRSVEDWLMATMERIMMCHSKKIIQAKDTVTVMNELRRGLGTEEIKKCVFV